MKSTAKIVLFTLFGTAAFLAFCVVLYVIVIVLPFRGILGDNLDYEQAKTETIDLFEKKREEFGAILESAVAGQLADDVSIKGVVGIHYKQLDQISALEFEVDAQGMLGGQYWGIYYVSDDQPLLFGLEPPDGRLKTGPYNGSYFLKGYFREESGIDFYATEKIEDNWYFYYMDYDGNTYGLDWQ